MRYRKKSSLILNRRKWQERKRKGFVSTDVMNRIHFKPKETKSQNNLIVVSKSHFLYRHLLQRNGTVHRQDPR